MFKKLGEKLKQAREGLGLTQEELAKAVGLSSEFISHLEIGRRSPSLDSLAALVKYLKKDFSYFLEEKEPIFKRLFKKKGIVNTIKDELQRFQKYCDDYLQMEEITGRRLEPAPLYFSTDPDKMASEERRRLGLGNEPIKNPFALFEMNGLRIFRYPLPVESRIAAVFIYVDAREAAFSMVNSAMPYELQTMAAAHQYCHYLKDRFQSPIFDNNDIFIDEHLSLYHPIEKFAQSFAQRFIVPNDKILECIQKDLRGDKLTYEDVFYLKRYFKVDILTILRILKELNVLSYSKYMEYRAMDHSAYEVTLFGKSDKTSKGKKKEISSDRFMTLAVLVCQKSDLQD